MNHCNVVIVVLLVWIVRVRIGVDTVIVTVGVIIEVVVMVVARTATTHGGVWVVDGGVGGCVGTAGAGDVAVVVGVCGGVWGVVG